MFIDFFVVINLKNNIFVIFSIIYYLIFLLIIIFIQQ
jgi:hypothetical protein